MRPRDRSATGGTGSRVNPVIDAPARIADARPDFTDAKAGEQLLAHFRLAVAVAVRQEIDVWSAQGHNAVAGRNHPVTRRQMIGEHGHAIEPAVTLGVF